LYFGRCFSSFVKLQRQCENITAVTSALLTAHSERQSDNKGVCSHTLLGKYRAATSIKIKLNICQAPNTKKVQTNKKVLLKKLTKKITLVIFYSWLL